MPPGTPAWLQSILRPASIGLVCARECAGRQSKTSTATTHVHPIEGPLFTNFVTFFYFFRCTVTLAVAVLLPAASCAVTFSTFVPSWRLIPLAVHLVVPCAFLLSPHLFPLLA